MKSVYFVVPHLDGVTSLLRYKYSNNLFISTASNWCLSERGLTKGKSYPLKILVVCSGSNIRQAWYLRSIATTTTDLVGNVPTTVLTCGNCVVDISSSLGISRYATKSRSPWTSPESSNKSYRNSSWLSVGVSITKPNILGCLAFWSRRMLVHFATAKYWSKHVRFENLLKEKRSNKTNIWKLIVVGEEENECKIKLLRWSNRV